MTNTLLNLLKLSVVDVAIMVEAFRRILYTCVNEGLECVDPPLLTSHYLQSMGYSEYTVRRLWSRLSGKKTIPVFKSMRGGFNIVLEHRKGPAYHDSITGIPIDKLDCSRIRSRCRPVSNANQLFVFLAGGIEDNMIKVNAIRVLYIVEDASGLGLQLVDTVKDIIKGDINAARRLVDIVTRLVKSYKNVLARVDPVFEEETISIVHMSPLLRLILGL